MNSAVWSSTRRPFYLITHRRNSVGAVAKALRDGANAIECDIRYKKSRGVFVVNHNHTRRYKRDNLIPYLQGVNKLARRYGNRFALIIFDFKDDGGDKQAGGRLLKTIREHLTNETKINVLISVARYSQRHALDTIIPQLRPREGIAIDEDDDPVKVLQHFQSQGVSNYGYGNGIFVLGIDRKIPKSIARALDLKQRFGKPKMIYVWTLAKKKSMRRYLRMGIDGIFVNKVKRLRKVLREKEFRSAIRLARRGENPFLVRPYAWQSVR